MLEGSYEVTINFGSTSVSRQAAQPLPTANAKSRPANLRRPPESHHSAAFDQLCICSRALFPHLRLGLAVILLPSILSYSLRTIPSILPNLMPKIKIINFKSFDHRGCRTEKLRVVYSFQKWTLVPIPPQKPFERLIRRIMSISALCKAYTVV
ncbi:hypothetical protein E4T47_05304 [Aureobasidium subglaciale]|nr:hypothetical protein E4T47_05304 [Aureobasidium subglaciale]